jgi:hypothetical protein
MLSTVLKLSGFVLLRISRLLLSHSHVIGQTDCRGSLKCLSVLHFFNVSNNGLWSSLSHSLVHCLFVMTVGGVLLVSSGVYIWLRKYVERLKSFLGCRSQQFVTMQYNALHIKKSLVEWRESHGDITCTCLIIKVLCKKIPKAGCQLHITKRSTTSSVFLG